MGIASHSRALIVALLATTSTAALAVNTTALAQEGAQQTRDAIRLDIEAQSLSGGLSQFAQQSGLQVLFSYGELQGLQSPALHGVYAREDALRLLLANSGYRAEIDGQTVRLEPLAGPQHAAADGNEEIVVTGSRLRGPGPSPVTVITRDDIENSGATSVPQLMRTLPQNFGGGPNETTRLGEGANNLLEGSSINLRGLGADSTLVLVNGHRISTGGTSNGLFVDVSAIPVSAIERVEVLTDGASAIYGSDAIGGVVNFILRDDFEGAETRMRYGAAYDGESAERGFSQSFGVSSESARFFAVYDFYARDPLANADRAFAASSDLRPFGGSNFSLNAGNPATVVSPIIAGVPTGQDGSGLTPGDFLVGQRNFQNTNEGQEIVGEQQRQTLYLSGALNITPSFELFGEVRASDREFERQRLGATTSSLRVPSSHPNFVALTPGSTQMILQYSFIDDLGPQISSGHSDDRSYIAGARLRVGDTWQAEMIANYGASAGEHRTDNAVNTPRLNEALGLTNTIPDFDPAINGYFNPLGDGSHTPQNVIDFIRGWAVTNYESRMEGINGQLRGELFALPAGPVQLALGGEYREETFETHSLEFTSALTPRARFSPMEERDVTAYFVEARLPVFAPDQNVLFFDQLDLTLALRREETSNGGGDSTPKFGALWSPFEGLALRASWGESFKSPSLTETIAGAQAALVFAIADPSAPGGTTTALILQGTNPGLESERAETWTAGFDLRPPSWPGFSLSVNFFRVEFDNRIAAPANVFTVLTQPDFYAPIITRNPDDALVQSYYDASFFIPIGPTPPAADVGAIVDGRLRNLSQSLVRGFDFSVQQRFAFAGDEWTASLAGTYLTDYAQAFSATAPLVNLVDTANYPVDLRLRFGLTWEHDAWTSSLFINYLDAYTDTVARRRVDAYTTTDISIAREFSGSLEGVSARLSARNLFNEDPPFLNNPIGVGYDPENADPIGRFVTFELVKTW